MSEDERAYEADVNEQLDAEQEDVRQEVQKMNEDERAYEADVNEQLDAEQEDMETSYVAPTTYDEVTAYRRAHGGTVVEAKAAVDKRHLQDAVAYVYATDDPTEALKALVEIVEGLVEKL